VDDDSARLRARIDELEASDSVTGLLSARAFRERLSGAFGTSETPGRAHLSLTVLEVDRFAELAAQLGCENAEGLLSVLGSVVRSHAPRAAAATRLGLSRFALAYFGTVKPEALAQAIGLQRAIASDEFLIGRAFVRVTASLGVTAMPDDGDDADDLFARAEAALRTAQAAGGNLVCGAGSAHQPENRRL